MGNEIEQTADGWIVMDGTTEENADGPDSRRLDGDRLK